LLNHAEHDNDNEDSFIKLAAATANVVRYLQKVDGPQEGPTRKPEPTKSEKEVANPEHGDAYIDAGLKRIRDFERRYRSVK
jgi:hypothetical protein